MSQSKATLVRRCGLFNQKTMLMLVKTVFDAMRPRYSLTKFTTLVDQILILEDRLSRPQDQSIYFRWAIPNHKKNLKKLHLRYAKFRFRFNEHTIDEFLDEVNGRKSFLRDVVAPLEASIVRNVAQLGSEEIIAEMSDMIHLKEIIGVIPEFEQLKQMPEEFEIILKAH